MTSQPSAPFLYASAAPAAHHPALTDAELREATQILQTIRHASPPRSSASTTCSAPSWSR